MSDSPGSIQISRKSFLSSVIVLGLLMLISGILTRFIPAGQFERVLEDGREVIVPGSYKALAGVSYPVWRWLTAPFEVLVSPDAATVIVIILYLLFIGGTFAILEKSGILRYIMSWVVGRYGQKKYTLMAVMVLVFMLFGSLMGIFEEIIALVPIVIVLALSLGWDSLVGLGMSLLAAGFGFAAAIANPFTLGVAQKLAGLPPFSGTLYRLLIFALIYVVLLVFLHRYARKIEANPGLSLVYQEDQPNRAKYASGHRLETHPDPKVAKGTRAFLISLLLVVLLLLAGSFIPALAAVSLPLVALIFMIGGLVSGRLTGYSAGQKGGLLKDLLKGMAGIAPAVLLILMAMSVKQIMTASQTMDTILFWASERLSGMSPYLAGLAIYALILALEFFISSGSAKAFLVIPIIAPLMDLTDLTRQAGVLAFTFGDGFSNVIFPTNAALMIALGLTVVSYPKWFRWTVGVQLVVLLLTILLLCIAIAFGYGPF